LAQFHAISATRFFHLPNAKWMPFLFALLHRLFLLCTNLSFPRAEMQFKCCRVAKRNFNVLLFNGETLKSRRVKQTGCLSSIPSSSPLTFPEEAAYVDHSLGFLYEVDPEFWPLYSTEGWEKSAKICCT